MSVCNVCEWNSFPRWKKNHLFYIFSFIEKTILHEVFTLETFLPLVSANGIPNEVSIPLAMGKMKELGFFNVMFEIDLGDSVWNFDKYPMERFLKLMKVRIFFGIFSGTIFDF